MSRFEVQGLLVWMGVSGLFANGLYFPSTLKRLPIELLSFFKMEI